MLDWTKQVFRVERVNELFHYLIFQEKEKEAAVVKIQESGNRKMEEKEEELKLGMEEQGLQKMAALSQQESINHQLQDDLRILTQVLILFYC